MTDLPPAQDRARDSLYLGAKPVRVLPRRPSQLKIEALVKAYPHHELRIRNNSGVHHHPFLAFERIGALEYVGSSFGKEPLISQDAPVLDVYGNQRATAKHVEHVHSVMPSLVASDLTRWRAADREAACQHMPLECRCTEFATVLWVHSLYYSNPTEVAELLMRSNLHWGLAIVHRYRGISGAIHGREQTWFRVSAERVRVSMDASTTEWEHDACDWLDAGVDLPSLGVHLEATMVWNEGATFVYQLMLRPYTARPGKAGPVPVWDAASSEEGGEDGMQLFALPRVFTGEAGRALGLTAYEVESARIAVGFGVVVYLYKTAKEVVLSSAIVSELATASLGKPRTGALYDAMLRKSRELYSTAPNLPPARKHDAVLYSVILAMSQGVADETTALLSMLHNHAALWKVHARTLPLENPPQSYSAWILAAGGLSTISSLAMCVVDPITVVHSGSLVTAAHLAPVGLHTLSAVVVATPVVALSIPLFTIVSSVASVAFTAWWYANRTVAHENVVGKPRPTSDPDVTAAYPGRPVTHFAYAPVFTALPASELKKPGPQRAESKVTTVTAPSLPNDAKPKMVLLGLGTGVTPTYYASDQDALVAAIKGRTTCEVPLMEANLERIVWDVWSKTAAYSEYKTATSGIRVKVGLREVETWAARYPKARRAELAKVFAELAESGFKPQKFHNAMQAFTKTEKQVALVGTTDTQVGTRELKAPRVILAQSDQHLVLVGPLVSQLVQLAAARRSIREAEDEDYTPGVCPTGVSSESVAAWQLRAERVLGAGDQLLAIDIDGSKWDAHVGPKAMKLAGKALVDHVNVEPAYAKHMMLNAPRVQGQNAKLGVKFSSTVSMATGAGWTSFYNGQINQMITSTILETGGLRTPAGSNLPSGLGKWYFLMVSGDDVAVLVSGSALLKAFGVATTDEVIPLWIEAGRRLGFTLTVGLGLARYTTFCSRYFYPARVTLESGRVFEGPLLGAKIGRAMVRAGWLLSKPDGVTLRSATVGLLKDNAHVPFLSHFYRKMLELLPKEGGRAPKDREHSIQVHKAQETTDETWHFLREMYDLTKEDLVEFEAILAQVSSLPAEIHWPRLAGILEREE